MTVLVGVKRSSDSRAAIRLAAQEAHYRDTTLIAVMAYPAERGWSPAVKPGATSLTRADDRAVGNAAERVEHRVVADLPGRALVRVAQTVNAQILVLAARQGIARVLGTVSQYELIAFTTKHQPRPTVAARTAATVGPMTQATFTRVVFSVTALRTKSRPTTSCTNACRAGLSTALSVPNSTARTTTCHSRMSPVSTAAPSAAETRPRPICVASSTCRLE